MPKRKTIPITTKYNGSNKRKQASDHSGPLLVPLTTTSFNSYVSWDLCRSAFDQSRSAFEQADYDHAISYTTLGIEDLIAKQSELIAKKIALLDIRAAANAKKCKFDDGLRDARRMVTLAPLLAAGYLRIGELHSLRANYQDAITIYQQGYDTVLKDDTGTTKQLFQQRIKEAQAHLDKQIDFVAHFPIEILPSIVRHLNLKGQITLLRVSKLWQQRLAGCVELWSRMKIHAQRKSLGWIFSVPSTTPGQQLNKGDLTLLFACVGYHVRELVLDNLDVDLSKEVFGVMMARRFFKLESLKLIDCDVPNTSNFLSILSTVTNTLKALCITVSDARADNFPMIPIKSVINLCHRLETFHYEHRVQHNMQSMGSFEYDGRSSGLIDLKLETYDGISPIDYCATDIEEILRFCPNLQRLAIPDFPWVSYQSIADYCKRLWFLSLNRGHNDASPNPITTALELNTTTTSDTSSAPREGGSNSSIQKLLAITDDGNRFVPLLEENRKSLQVMSMIMRGNLPTWNIFYTMGTMETLWHLDIHHWADDLTSIIAPLLRQSPNLVRLELNKGYLEREAWTAIAGLVRLTFLRLEKIQYTNGEDALRMFQIISSRSSSLSRGGGGGGGGTQIERKNSIVGGGDDDGLQTVILRRCGHLVNDDVMNLITSISSLRMIEIAVSNDDYTTEQGMSLFFEKLQLHPLIERLDFTNLKSITSANFKYLRSIRKLKFFRMIGLDHVKWYDLKEFDTHITWEIHKCFGDWEEKDIQDEKNDFLRNSLIRTEDLGGPYFSYPTYL
ncbi:hypothetical protein BDA99DRAFT_516199 [Phascolomyces articulosus]|uniref:F-box domain-containing protein n=1 Tax=Phascolomyces articulosus TaxID=60185 RepID=A0AAD5PBV2_9FUNG|nr:hypothetical protein BDA99DRAFT_516199 [Phascolomyces articulosus]